MQMEYYICNKCQVTMSRGNIPFSLTQCGHVYCQICVREAEKICPQCNSQGTLSIPLTKPLMPKIESYFASVSGSLVALENTCIFQDSQMRITLQRFLQLDKKYDALKTEYWKVLKNMKLLSEKYYKLKAEKEKTEKKMIYLQMHNSDRKPLSLASHNHSSIASSSQRTGQSRRQGIFLNSLSEESNNITPAHMMGMRRTIGTRDGFRVPTIPRSIGSTTLPSDASSYYR